MNYNSFTLTGLIMANTIDLIGWALFDGDENIPDDMVGFNDIEYARDHIGYMFRVYIDLQEKYDAQKSAGKHDRPVSVEVWPDWQRERADYDAEQAMLQGVEGTY